MTVRSPSASPSPDPMKPRRKSCARKCERACCSIVTYFPLAFVYGLTTWAIWVEAGIGFSSGSSKWINPFSSILGIALYILLNWSYTTAVFTDPGSPSTTSGTAGYSHLPTHEVHRDAPSFTVKSTGETRFCKKCQAKKPDRSHHCSTCGRCVLKMDHHCPWLATCVGLSNYKAFLLFTLYTSLYCWVCFAVTTIWLWSEVFSDSQYTDSFMPINYILLAVISGIIGLVLTGFTIWHISLAFKGQTTIECLETTRYLTPLKKSMRRQQYGQNGAGEQSYGQQLAEIHANAIPGVTRPEEGDAMLAGGDLEQGHGSRGRDSLRRDYNEMERSKERERYEDYLDEKDSEKLPSAFDLGWRRNLTHLFGDRLLLCFLPICNTSGDGWHWEPNPKWVEARDAIRKEREGEWQEQEARGREGVHHSFAARRRPPAGEPERHYVAAGAHNLGNGAGYFDRSPDGSPSSRMSMKTIRRRGSFDTVSDEDDYDGSSDEERSRWPSSTSKSDDDARKQD